MLVWRGLNDTAIKTSMTLLEFTNYLEVDTPLGKGTAFMIKSRDNDYYWNVVLTESLAIVAFRQNQLKMVRNYSMGWGFSDDQMRKIIKKWTEKNEHTQDTVREPPQSR